MEDKQELGLNKLFNDWILNNILVHIGKIKTNNSKNLYLDFILDII